MSLPTDSAARKALPLHSGCFAFFPAVWPGLLDSLARNRVGHLSTDVLRSLLAQALVAAPRSKIALLFLIEYACELALRQATGQGCCEARLQNEADALVRYAPVFAELARLAVAGNKKHCNGDGILRHRRRASADHLDAAARHVIDALGPTTIDPDDGQLHAVKAVWRYAAQLQELAEAEGAPVAPAAELGEG